MIKTMIKTMITTNKKSYLESLNDIISKRLLLKVSNNKSYFHKECVLPNVILIGFKIHSYFKKTCVLPKSILIGFKLRSYFQKDYVLPSNIKTVVKNYRINSYINYSYPIINPLRLKSYLIRNNQIVKLVSCGMKTTTHIQKSLLFKNRYIPLERTNIITHRCDILSYWWTLEKSKVIPINIKQVCFSSNIIAEQNLIKNLNKHAK